MKNKASHTRGHFSPQRSPVVKCQHKHSTHGRHSQQDDHGGHVLTWNYLWIMFSLVKYEDINTWSTIANALWSSSITHRFDGNMTDWCSINVDSRISGYGEETRIIQCLLISTYIYICIQKIPIEKYTFWFSYHVNHCDWSTKNSFKKGNNWMSDSNKVPHQGNAASNDMVLLIDVLT